MTGKTALDKNIADLHIRSIDRFEFLFQRRGSSVREHQIHILAKTNIAGICVSRFLPFFRALVWALTLGVTRKRHSIAGRKIENDAGLLPGAIQPFSA